MARPEAAHGNLATRDLASLFFGLCFGQSGPCDFGIGEDDRGNRVRLESNFMSGDGFYGSAALMHCLVGQHRFAGHVANGVDRGIGSLPLLVDFDESLLA